MARFSALKRIINSTVVNPTLGPRRVMNTITQPSLGILSTATRATSPLSTGEMSVATAFLVLFGRSPDRSGLNYWVSVVGSSANITTSINTIMSYISGSAIIDTDPATQIAMLYHHLLAKVPEEDSAGIAYWTSLLTSGSSFGLIAETVINIVMGLSDYNALTMKNRLLALESICRIQKAQSYDLSIADSRSAVLRVDGMVASYNEAIADIERLLIAKTASTAMSWGKAWTYSSLAAEARVYSGSAVSQVRNVVWYNRNGNMMLAKIFLPSNFASYNSHHAIIALHGGGWRQGYPEKIYSYCTALAIGTYPSYVVLAPTYRLSAYGHTSPAPEQDVADFYAFVDSATFLRQGTPSPGIFGESSGGHLGCYVGATQNIPRVMAIYPPINLTGNPAVSSGLDIYVDYYTPTTALQASASVDLSWTSGRTTQFQLWHGLSDGFVPSAQSTSLDTVAGTNCTVIYKPGEGHGFTVNTQSEVLSAARSFFNS